MRYLLAALLALLLMLLPTPARAECYTVPITVNTPTGIAGCERWGEGIASWYGPGNGVAMNFCTWALRHSSDCGWVTISSLETGRSATVPVIDFGDLYTGTPQERIVDLQFGVLDMLGLDRGRGLYRVRVERAGGSVLPDTAMR